MREQGAHHRPFDGAILQGAGFARLGMLVLGLGAMAAAGATAALEMDRGIERIAERGHGQDSLRVVGWAGDRMSRRSDGSKVGRRGPRGRRRVLDVVLEER
ncbi:hypothetical protein RZS08_51235, partial [Arthrospira platensis SPKY1]|nr:hypothetical protein [Arthrospira platensis SPKY1]